MLAAGREVFDGGVKELIERIYAPDFATFGDRWSFDRLSSRSVSWSEDAFKAIRVQSEMGQRIRDLVNSQGAQRKALQARDDEVSALRRRVVELERATTTEVGPEGSRLWETIADLGRRIDGVREINARLDAVEEAVVEQRSIVSGQGERIKELQRAGSKLAKSPAPTRSGLPLLGRRERN